MSDVKQISHDQAIGQVARQQAEAVKTQPEALRETDPKAPVQDLVQVDAQRAEEARLEENAKLLMDELPDVRPDRVAEAKRKLTAGVYDRPEILEQTAGKIAQDLNAQAAVPAPDVARARNRLAQGYYEQPEVLDETAKKIVNREL